MFYVLLYVVIAVLPLAVVFTHKQLEDDWSIGLNLFNIFR